MTKKKDWDNTLKSYAKKYDITILLKGEVDYVCNKNKCEQIYKFGLKKLVE